MQLLPDSGNMRMLAGGCVLSEFFIRYDFNDEHFIIFYPKNDGASTVFAVWGMVRKWPAAPMRAFGVALNGAYAYFATPDQDDLL